MTSQALGATAPERQDTEGLVLAILAAMPGFPGESDDELLAEVLAVESEKRPKLWKALRSPDVDPDRWRSALDLALGDLLSKQLVRSSPVIVRLPGLDVSTRRIELTETGKRRAGDIFGSLDESAQATLSAARDRFSQMDPLATAHYIAGLETRRASAGRLTSR